MPEDLKRYSDRSGWNLLSEDEAGELLVILAIGGIFMEGLYSLGKWMFA